MDKVVVKFIADLLYVKDVICFEEFEAIMDSCNGEDLDNVIDRVLRGDFNVYRRGNISTE